jgi:Holliday junction resolvase RusA-like endonuclease
MKLSFFVAGIPAPGGSKKAFVIPGTNRARIVDDAKGNRDWKSHVARTAHGYYQGEPLSGPLDVTMLFTMPRPRDHYRTGKHRDKLKDSAPYYHTSKPDVLKLTRSTEDACTGILWRDDALTVRLQAVKVYGSRPGVEITVERLREDGQG